MHLLFGRHTPGLEINQIPNPGMALAFAPLMPGAPQLPGTDLSLTNDHQGGA